MKEVRDPAMQMYRGRIFHVEGTLNAK